jgi:2-polyprenyl-3-methyl-5-hydroxy-6-metoxy-1,4-benzoquinol methylase
LQRATLRKERIVLTLAYWCGRLIRRRIPQAAIEWMLDRGVFLRPGVDTRAPEGAANDLIARCVRREICIEGKRVCVVGYGGSFGIALALLNHGAKHVVLQDPFAPIRHKRIQALDPAHLARYFIQTRKGLEPDPERITLVHDHLSVFAKTQPESIDVVYSSSVLEHVSEVDRLIKNCADVSRADAINIHHVDLRDHFFRYPFEMLCYGARIWERWLNTSNLNRCRLDDYERIFAHHFASYDVQVTQALPDEFKKIKKRIRPEFLTGDDSRDCVGTCCIEARIPVRGRKERACA